MVAESLPNGSEFTLALMSIAGAATWVSSNIYVNKILTGFFATIGIASAIILMFQIM